MNGKKVLSGVWLLYLAFFIIWENLPLYRKYGGWLGDDNKEKWMVNFLFSFGSSRIDSSRSVSSNYTFLPNFSWTFQMGLDLTLFGLSQKFYSNPLNNESLF